jgi:hypothetical protein
MGEQWVWDLGRPRHRALCHSLAIDHMLVTSLSELHFLICKQELSVSISQDQCEDAQKADTEMRIWTKRTL